MKIIWLREASIALDFQYEYLSKRNSKIARLVLSRIVATTRRLLQFPLSGRPGQTRGTRELFVPGLPYLIVYRVGSTAIEIIRVFYTAREPLELLIGSASIVSEVTPASGPENPLGEVGRT